MKLVTQYELAVKTKPELHGLYREVFDALAQSEPGSAVRRNALASLENIARELASRG